MVKNNFWNRFFHKEAISASQVEADLAQQIICMAPEIIKNLEAATSLTEVLRLHKQAWSLGFQNPNLGPCSYGYFRTSSIEAMKPEEVFLGGIWGLFTKNIIFWDNHKKDTYGCNGYGIDSEKSIYFDFILPQYHKHVISNIRAIERESKETLKMAHQMGYKTICQND